MTSPLPAEQWQAIRALREGEPPTFERLAAASGLHPVTIRQRALRDSWEKRYLPRSGSRAAVARKALLLSEGSGAVEPVAETAASPEELHRHLQALLIRRHERIAALAEVGLVDKAEFDMAAGLRRVIEGSGEIIEEQSTEQKNRSDDQLAALLGTIDDRIVELAQAYAGRLGGADDREGMG